MRSRLRGEGGHEDHGCRRPEAEEPWGRTAPPKVRDFMDGDRSSGIRDRPALLRQVFRLTKLGNDLFRFAAPPPCHSPPPRPKTYFRADQFGGGGSDPLGINHILPFPLTNGYDLITLTIY